MEWILKKNGFSIRMDWDFKFYDFKILTEKMILILNIGMNWKTDLLSQLLGLFCFLGDVGGGSGKSWKMARLAGRE